MRPTCSSRRWRAAAAHHRRHHLCRIQEAHREGPGADPPLPGVQVGRTRRAQGHPDDAWRGQHDGEAPQGADPGRGAGSGRQAVAPLHPGAPAARQGVSLLDTACARVAVSLHATPAEVDDSRKRIEAWRPSWASSAVRRPSASTPASARPRSTELLAPSVRAWPTLERAGSKRKGLVDELLACAPSCAGRQAGRRHRQRLEAEDADAQAEGRPPRRRATERPKRAGRPGATEGCRPSLTKHCRARRR
jgi:hypothetical protein